MTTAPEWVRAHLRPGEDARWWGRAAPAGVLAVLAYAAVTTAAIVISYVYGFERGGLILTGAPALVVAVAGILFESARRVARLLRTSYVVTDERLYVITARFATDVQVVPLARVARIELRQGPLGRLLRYWTADVRAYGEEERGRVRVRAVRDGPGLLGQLGRGATENARASWLLHGD